MSGSSRGSRTCWAAPRPRQRSARRALEESADPELRWRNLAHNAGLDQDLIDPTKPLSEEVAATAEGNTFAQYIVGQARSTQLPFGELAQKVTGLPGGLEFTGTPEQMADLIEEWVTRGGSDGFTLQPTTSPDSLEQFVDHVVPILQRRGLHRTEYTGDDPARPPRARPPGTGRSRGHRRSSRLTPRGWLRCSGQTIRGPEPECVGQMSAQPA